MTEKMKFKIGDKIMGFDEGVPFYGEIIESDDDYEVYGYTPFGNKLTEDGGELFWLEEHQIAFYDSKLCDKAFKLYDRIKTHRKEIKKLEEEIRNLLKPV